MKFGFSLSGQTKQHPIRILTEIELNRIICGTFISIHSWVFSSWNVCPSLFAWIFFYILPWNLKALKKNKCSLHFLLGFFLGTLCLLLCEWNSSLYFLIDFPLYQFSSVQSLSHVRLFTTPWTAAHQASLSITNSRSPPKPMYIAIPPSHPLSSPSPPAPNPSKHQGLFKQVSSLHQVAKVLEFQLQHQSYHWIFRTDFL